MPRKAKRIIFILSLLILTFVLIREKLADDYEIGPNIGEYDKGVSEDLFVTFPEITTQTNISESSDAGREEEKKRCEENGGVWTQGYRFEGKCTEKQIVEKCERNDGVWMQGPFGEGPFCNKVYSDGGKSCTDSKDCLSNQCIIYPSELKESPNIVGECAKWQVNYGCYELLKNGRMTGYMCRD